MAFQGYGVCPHGDKYTVVSFRTSGHFEMKLAFAVIFGFFKQFLGTKVELIYRCQRQEKFMAHSAIWGHIVK